MKKRIWLLLSGVFLVLIIAVTLTFSILNSQNKLSSDERTWINTNINNVSNVYIMPDENLFSKNGHGVFYTFLNDVKEEYGINFNVVTNIPDNVNGITFTRSETLSPNAKLFYTDHYILVSKEEEYIKDISDLDGLKIGVLTNDAEYIKTYLKDIVIDYSSYDTIDNLLTSLNNDTKYIIIPRIEYIDTILENNLQIIYHFSDINSYYTLNGIGDTLSNILYKYFEKWDNFTKSLKEEEFSLFTNALNISASDVDKLLSIDYNYGFINNSPYEVIMSGKYGGIIKEYLQEFSEFSGVYFKINKYRNIDKLVKAINRNKIDIYFDFNKNIEDNYTKTTNGILSSISIITKKDNSKIFNSIYSLQGEEVYVEEGSNILKYLVSLGNINIHTYKDIKEIYKLNKDDIIIAMDSYIFDYLSTNRLSNYVSKYNTYINDLYSFKIKSEYQTLNTLLDRYIEYLDSKSMISIGLNSHTEVMTKGNILNNIAKYIILFISAILVISFIVYKNTKKIRIARRLKKDEKIRFIDELTCLKNRAYLSDSMKNWSNNKIYPQSIIVVDLNKLTEINEKYGVAEGDKQIQAFANALIKTQLDNSDLIRSDGNEFVIYNVGYNQKQIINYIHKLNKELKKLPYNYGAEFGYSIIENNLKTIEDALTEAIEDMKEKKNK